MMFIIRGGGEPPEAAGVQIKLSRATPVTVPGSAAKTDFFCIGEADAMAALRAAGWTIVELHDGYYEDGAGGGVGIWGHGRYWEIRSDPFTIKEAVCPAAPGGGEAGEGEHVEVRRTIFGV